MEPYAQIGDAGPFAASADLFTALVAELEGPGAAGLTACELEDLLAERGREVQRQLLQDHLDLRAAREEQAAREHHAFATGADGITRTRLETGHGRLLATLFGTVQVTRCAWRRPGTPSLCPADAALSLPACRRSHSLARLAAVEAARGSFEAAHAAITRRCGPVIGKRQVEQAVVSAARDIAAFYAARIPVPCTASTLLVISADSKGVVMRPEALRPATAKAAARQGRMRTRLTAGEKPNRKRMATLACVYDAEPAPRRPHDVIAPPGGRRGSRKLRPRPKARAKWLAGSVEHDPAEVIATAFDQAEARDPVRRRTWVVLVDGAEHQLDLIRSEAAQRGVAISIVIDLVHVLELSAGPRPALINVNDDRDNRVLASLLPSYLRGFSDEKEQGAMAYCLAVRPAGGDRTWTVVDASYATVGPVEEWLEAHRHLWSPNTVRGYATGLAQWWSFLEQRGEQRQWTEAGAPAVAGFLSWLRNGRTVERALTWPAETPSAETLRARLAALISFYQWQEAVHSVPVAGRLLRGRPARLPSRGLLAHLDGRREPGPSSLVKVRCRRAGRPPLLLPGEIQAIIDGCATWDDAAGEWAGNLRDRLLFSIFAETGMRLGEVMGMAISDFVMGRGGTAYIDVVPREQNPNGARVKMMRPRRIHVSADLERLFADYLTHLACRAAGLGLDVSPGSPLLVNLDRPPLLAAIREGTVRDKVAALKKKGIGPAGWTPHWFRHSHASALLLAGTPEWVVSRRLGHAHVQTTIDLYGWVREDEALRAAANWKTYAAGWRAGHGQ